jgi:ribosomal protein L40E
MLICQACGAENRDKARFCLGCAKALESPPEAAKAPPPQGPQQICSACQTSNPLAATVCKSCRASLIIEPGAVVPPLAAVAPGGSSSRTFALVGLVFVVLAAGAWWLGFLGRPGDTAMAANNLDASSANVAPAAVLATQAAASVPEALTGTAGATPAAVVAKASRSKQAPTASAKESRKQRIERLQQERAAAMEAQQQAALEQQRAALAKQRADQIAAQRAAQEKLAKVAVQAPVAARSVAQTCDTSGNFFAREVCKVKACGDAAFARDPVCVRFRQTEAENRKELSY